MSSLNLSEVSFLLALIKIKATIEKVVLEYKFKVKYVSSPPAY
ncbi:hypothetical protein [Chengkuizengella axinellae]|uniref:Uncharacterized protein n=1 Tax=Chengkuizengella axinellae TaxID=3064388 RepID=A0ABT9J3X7_9BACL|nr:hypothetical protein [Chengkuizengella sp. 2205SS18-9]MDP5276340.1 hypothetical protein [Chengkuizengella sp. 2205SS18-9]